MNSENYIAINNKGKECDFSYLAQKYEELNIEDKKYALVHINIKNFRYFTTSYGESAANEILELFFQKIKMLLKEEEYAGHIYADNFILLLQYMDIDKVIYERLMHLIDNIYRIEDDRIYRNLFISMGIYQIENKSVTFQEAFNYANLTRKECPTLYNRSSCMEVYDKKFYNTYMNRMDLEVKTANAYKNYEFVIYLQPKIDLKSECIIGAEALLRWFDKDGKAIPLNEFLPILNRNSYIELIDMDTFEQMCQYLDTRIKNNQKVVPISFNISKAYFYEPDLLRDYIQVFEKYNIPKDLIELELMESVTLDDTEYMKNIIQSFKDYGFKCSLDDFGTGYSSFAVLLNAPLDSVKMDRQFFLNNLNGNAELIIKSMVKLIHDLQMQVVAEGVEDKAHIEFLKECGCDFVQGYYYYKPMPAEDFGKLLDTQEREK